MMTLSEQARAGEDQQPNRCPDCGDGTGRFCAECRDARDREQEKHSSSNKSV